MTQAELMDRIDLQQREARRLMAMLRYYDWLVTQGMAWDTVRGVADVSDLPHLWPSRWRKPSNCYSYRLADGSCKIAANVPFPPQVIFNRSFLTSNEREV
jgi:hypothetical protein